MGIVLSLVTSNLHVGSVSMLVLVKLRQEQLLGFMGIRIKGQPALVVGMNDPRLVDASGAEPSAH